MKKIIVLLFIIMSASTMVHAQKPHRDGARTVAQAQTNNPVVMNVDDFSKQISEPKVVVVDVRTNQEFATGHIAGALNIVWDDAFQESVRKAKLKNGYTLAVYCRSGRRSHQAAQTLVQMGYPVVELEGGILSWQAAGKQIEK